MNHILQNKQKRKRRVWPVVALTAIGVGVLNYIAADAATVTHRRLASAIIIVGLIPTFVYFYKRESNIPFLPVWGLLYAIFFAVPVFLLEEYSIREVYLSDDALNDALVLALLGAALLLAAFYLIPAGILRSLPSIKIALDPIPAQFAALALSVLGLIAGARVAESSSFDAVIGFVSSWPLLSLAILYVLFLKGQLKLLSKVYLWLVLLPIILLKDIGTGVLANPLRDLLLLLFLYWSVRRKIPIKAIVVCILIVVPFFGVKQEFRERSWFGEEINTGPLEKGVSFISLVGRRLSGNSLELYESSIDATSRRTANILLFGFVVQTTPEEIPYWEGETYKTLLTTLVPRFLWPDKPKKTLGQDFGHRYGVLDDHDTNTSVNLPQVTEMYANFGWWGVALLMPMLGLVYRIIYTSLNHSNMGEGGLAIAVLIFVGLLNIESDLSLVIGGILQTTLAYIVLLKVITKRQRAVLIKQGTANIRVGAS